MKFLADGFKYLPYCIQILDLKLYSNGLGEDIENIKYLGEFMK